MDLIRKGDQGLGVGRVQQLLTEAGYNIPQTELMSMRFLDGTYAAVRAFQASHTGPDGHPLSEDGVIGDETSWALQHPGGGNKYILDGWRYDASMVRAEVRPVLDIAVAEIGVCEQPDGSNDGPQVRKYTSPGFIGDPWCALFTWWAFQKGLGSCPFGRVAATWAIYNWAKANARLLSDAAMPQPGDLFLILRGDPKDPNHHGHTMMVCADLGGMKYATVAGNESNAVRGGIRQRSAVSAVVRPIPLA